MKITKKYVFFWGGIFSNYHACDIMYENHRFISSEQLFMYLKAKCFKDEESMKLILSAKTPQEAKNYGRLVKNYNDGVWKKHREDMMFIAVHEKAKQHPYIRKAVLEYKDKIFVEASPHDKIWGIGLHETDPRVHDPVNWQGENLLGKTYNRLLENLL